MPVDPNRESGKPGRPGLPSQQPPRLVFMAG